MLLLFQFFILILWILQLTISDVLAFCPPRCKCNEVELIVYCNQTQIDLVPIMLNPQLKELYLGGNRIKNIYSSFIVYQDLQYLDVSNNLINDVGKKSFIMQKKLRILLLNENNITQINNLSFYGLDSLYLVNISHNQLVEIPSRIFMSLNKLQVLDLSYNHISYINREAFFGLLNLKRLLLHNNLLKRIPSASFYHLQSLVQLSIGKNLFTNILELAFSPLAILEELIIDSCFISAISSRAFMHLSSLYYLDLQNNRLANVPSESLSIVTTLKTLNLSHNLITVLNRNAFKNLTHLHTLIISSSPLSFIDKDAFIDNINLNKLVIENNKKLNRILTGTFHRQYDSLQHLSLRANMISFLDWQTINLKRLQYIDLQHNPLVCNCSMSWLAAHLQQQQQRFKNNTKETSLEQVKCYSPIHLYGRKLITLSETDLSCSKLNSTIKIVVNIFTYAALLILIMTLAIVICRRRKSFFPSCCSSCCCTFCNNSCCRRRERPMSPSEIIANNHNHHHPQHYHQHNNNNIIINNSTLPPKSRFENSFYYPPIIINDELTRDSKHYRTMTNSTRTSALSVDLHPIPNRYIPIAHI